MMRWLNKFVWWLLIASVCSGNRILEELKSKTTRVAWNQMAELMKLCFSERTNPIVITADLDDAIYGTSREVDHPNLNVIDHDYEARQTQVFNPAYPTYILSANSADQMKDLLDALKLSPTWSLTSVFFIIGTNEKSCSNASKMLQVLWKSNLISAFYVCYESDDKDTMMLYTYNPFTDRAPEPWVEVESTDRPDDRWSLYKQPYTNDKGACKNLTYDKTKSLDGYEVKAVSTSLLNYTHGKTYDIDSLQKYNWQLQHIEYPKTLFSALNATPALNYDKPGYWMKNTATGYLKKIISGAYDLALDIRKLNQIPGVDFTSSNYQSSHMILTQRKSIVRTTENFEAILNLKIFGVTILILVISFVIIVIHNGRDYGSGFLDIIRLAIGFGIDAPLDKLPVRVVFLVTTIFVFVVSPDIQGQILALSTKPERYYPQNLKDLSDFKFNLYYSNNVKDFMKEQTAFLNLNESYLRMFSHHPSTCDDKVLNHSSNACLGRFSHQVQAAYDHNLHLTQEILNPTYVTYWTKKDWVLKDKVDKLTSRFTELGLLDIWDRQESKYIFKKFKARELIENAGAEYDDIAFENLTRIYLFVFLCLVFGTLIFVAELVIAKYKAARHKRTIIRTLEKRVKYVGGRLILIN